VEAWPPWGAVPQVSSHSESRKLAPEIQPEINPRRSAARARSTPVGAGQEKADGFVFARVLWCFGRPQDTAPRMQPLPGLATSTSSSIDNLAARDYRADMTKAPFTAPLYYAPRS